MPPRGSIQDRVAQEMVLRQRRQEMAKFAYLGRLTSLSLGLPEKLYGLWTELLALEVFQDNYSPRVTEAKKQILSLFENMNKNIATAPQDRVNIAKVESLEVGNDQFKPSTAEEREEALRKIKLAKLRKTVRGK